MTMRERYQIAKDEGVRYRTYTDTLNYPTGGIGHLLSDGEAVKYPIGTAIPSVVVEQWFNEDMITAIETVDKLVKNKGISVSDELHDILTNMAFNLGETRLRKFKCMWLALKDKKYDEAAKEMKDSLWFQQVGNRSKRLYERMKTMKGYDYVGNTNTCTG